MKSYFRNWNSLTRGALYNFNKLLKYVNVIQFDYARNSSIMDAAMNGVRNPPLKCLVLDVSVRWCSST